MGRLAAGQSEAAGTAFAERKRSLLFGLPLSFTVYRITESELTIRRGFLNPAEESLPLERLASVTLHRGPAERWFHLGSLSLATTDPARPSLRLRRIRRFDSAMRRLTAGMETAD